MDPKIFETFAAGYSLGYSQPEAESGTPYAEPWKTYYEQGMASGREVRRDADAQYTGPTIGPDPGGESWDHYQSRYQELLEALFHQHMPHVEISEYEMPPPPPVNVVR